MNIIDYVRNTNLTFEEEPFNIVDSLVLSQLFYVKIEAVLAGDREKSDVSEIASAEVAGDKEVLSDRETGGTARHTLKDFYKAEYFSGMFSDGITDEKNFELFCAACASPRFRDLEVKNVEVDVSADVEKQFAAMTYVLDDCTEYVAFRGTDGTILGWKEDFKLSFMDEIPSQKSAVDYMNRWFSRSDKRLYIGGHSKGGNLAVYGTLMSEPSIHDKVLKVYSFEGPGFRDDVSAELIEIAERDGIEIIKVVPQTSVIGMLLSTQSDVHIIESNALGLMQHSAFTWQIDDKDFRYRDEPSIVGAFSDRTIHNWLASLDDSERESFTEKLFDILFENDINSVHDIKSLDVDKIGRLFAAFWDMDAESKRMIQGVLSKLGKEALRAIV